MEKLSFHVKCEQFMGAFTTYAYAWNCYADVPSNPEKLVCLFDTGSDIGIINIATANRLGLYPSDELRQYETAGGPSWSSIYKADICLPGGMVFRNRPFKGVQMPIDIMVGMDIMILGEMSLHFQEPYLEMSFTSDRYDLYLPDLCDGLGIKF